MKNLKPNTPRTQPSRMLLRVTRAEFTEMQHAVWFLLEKKHFTLDEISAIAGHSNGWWSHVKNGHPDEISPKGYDHAIILAIQETLKRERTRHTKLFALQGEFSAAMSHAIEAGVNLLKFSTGKR